MELTVKLADQYLDETRKALNTRWQMLDKRAKTNEQEGIDSDARTRMGILEEVMRQLDPQIDLVDEINRPPESYRSGE